jgi:hypothetical protein
MSQPAATVDGTMKMNERPRRGLGKATSLLEGLGVDPRKQTKEIGARLLPTGECWCGCGTETPIGSFFAAGHDKVAESAVILLEYGGVADFLVRHGFGPLGRNARQELDAFRSKSSKSR